MGFSHWDGISRPEGILLHSLVGGHYSVAIAYDRTNIKTSSGAGKEMLAAVMDVRSPLGQAVKNKQGVKRKPGAGAGEKRWGLGCQRMRRTVGRGKGLGPNTAPLYGGAGPRSSASTHGVVRG